MFLILFTSMSSDIISKTELILLGDKLLPVINNGFLRYEESVNLNNFPTLDGVGVLVGSAIFMDTL